MKALDFPLIDWRHEHQRIQPFIERRGGVVHVQGTADAAMGIFADIIAWKLQEQGHLVLRVNGDESTRYFDGILVLLEDWLNVPQLESDTGSSNIQVGTGLNAGGNINIQNINVQVTGLAQNAEGHSSRTFRIRPRCKRIIEHMHQMFSSRRVCLIFFQTNTHTSDALSDFKEYLWEEGLEELVKDGLLLLDFHTDSRWASERWPLTLMPDEQITLIGSYSPEARAHASEDLAQVLQAWETEMTDRQSIAKGIAATVAGPKEMYTRLASIKLNVIELLKVKAS